MASVWIRTRTTATGEKRHRVEYRPGGRDTSTRFAGSLKTRRLATIRAAYVESELAAGRIPDLTLGEAVPVVPMFKAASERWLASRLDVSEGTRTQQRTSINRAIKILGPCRIDEISAHDVAAMIVTLVGEGLKPSFVRKIVQATAMLFDHARHQAEPGA